MVTEQNKILMVTLKSVSVSTPPKEKMSIPDIFTWESPWAIFSVQNDLELSRGLGLGVQKKQNFRWGNEITINPLK